MQPEEKYQTFYNPGGFVELCFYGEQTPESVVAAVTELVNWSEKLSSKKKKIYILVDATEVPKLDISGKMAAARREAVKAMTTAKYDRIAIYGGVAVQIMVNTLVMIAGKRQNIRVFSDRFEALSWLKDEA